MYNAYKDKGRYGSTCIHSDVADAVNLMPFATNDGITNNGAAIWTIFRREDFEALDEFMRIRFHVGIHQQKIYLTSEDLCDLERQTGIRPYVFHQRPGDMVFIPAHCVHQVSRMLDHSLTTSKLYAR
jgi:lysine-specific demethylase 3